MFHFVSFCFNYRMFGRGGCCVWPPQSPLPTSISHSGIEKSAQHSHHHHHHSRWPTLSVVAIFCLFFFLVTFRPYPKSFCKYPKLISLFQFYQLLSGCWFLCVYLDLSVRITTFSNLIPVPHDNVWLKSHCVQHFKREYLLRLDTKCYFPLPFVYS